MTKLYLPLSKKLAVLLLTLITSVAWSQSRTVTGKVTSADDGSALPGVNIIEKGTSNGTVTDSDGAFSITVNDNAVLVFSFVGMASQEVPVGSQTNISVGLQADLTNLGEVVVVGYQIVRKQDLTGSVAQVSSNDFNKGIYVSPSELFQGKMAGVVVTGASGAPGAETSINIRGVNSIRGGNGPLIVVDGVQLDNNQPKGSISIPGGMGNTPGIDPLSFINPNDIATFDVLKDASAAAIYGSRGANGVVIITTKKPREGGTIDFQASAGVSNIVRQPEVLTGDQFREALKTEEITVGDYGSNVNAFDEITQTGSVQNYNISFAAGSDASSHRFSIGYTDQKGVIKESGLTKINAMMKSNYKFLNDRVSVDILLLGADIKQESAPIGNNSSTDGNIISQALQWNPTRPLYENGDFLQPASATEVNPMATLKAYDDNFAMKRLIGSIAPTINIAKGLDYRVQIGFDDVRGERQASLKKLLWISGAPTNNLGSAYLNEAKFMSQQMSHTLVWNKDFGGIKLSALGGYEYVRQRQDLIIMTATGFSSDEIDFVKNIQNALPNMTSITYDAPPDAKLQSFFGRAFLNFNDKYLVTATVRSDGSSKFGANNRYATFPSFAVATNLHEFDFVPDVFDNLKVRAGWGLTGSQTVPPGAATDIFGYAAGSGTKQVVQLNVGNPDLKWESTETINVGVDFGLQNSRFSGSVEYFHRKSKDFLYQVENARPAPSGFVWKNIDGEIVNSGLEINLNAWVVDRADFKVELGTNITFLKNVYNRPGSEAFLQTGEINGKGLSNVRAQVIVDGQPINVFKLRDWTGIGADGFSTYRDFDPIAGISPKFYVGDPNPNAVVGIYANFMYNKFDASINLNGQFGHQIYNNTANAVFIKGNLIAGSRNTSPDLIGNGEDIANVSSASSRYLENGDFMRLANVSVGYNWDFDKAIKKVRLYVTGQNLHVFTNYSGFDPEVNTDKSISGVPSRGIEYTPYPRARTFLVGVTASF